MILDLLPSLKLTAVRTWKWRVCNKKCLPRLPDPNFGPSFHGIFGPLLKGALWLEMAITSSSKRPTKIWEFMGKNLRIFWAVGMTVFSQIQTWRAVRVATKVEGWFAPSSCLVGTRTYFPPKRKARNTRLMLPFPSNSHYQRVGLGAFFLEVGHQNGSWCCFFQSLHYYYSRWWNCLHLNWKMEFYI